tara:strand:- start:804 stop:1382 length:579 start_codon:yes stop_codon:yes gene_type:complete
MNLSGCVLPDDGGRSRGDWVFRPLITDEPVLENVFQANLAGANHSLREWPGKGHVINTCMETIKDGRANNSLAIQDESDVDNDVIVNFLTTTADAIEKASSEYDWVVVNCKGGVNRSTAALLSWMNQKKGLKLPKAKGIITKKKAATATRLRFKNRYQSFVSGANTEHKFSWPSLYGNSAPKMWLYLGKVSK